MLEPIILIISSFQAAQSLQLADNIEFGSNSSLFNSLNLKHLSNLINGTTPPSPTQAVDQINSNNFTQKISQISLSHQTALIGRDLHQISTFFSTGNSDQMIVQNADFEKIDHLKIPGKIVFGGKTASLESKKVSFICEKTVCEDFGVDDGYFNEVVGFYQQLKGGKLPYFLIIQTGGEAFSNQIEAVKILDYLQKESASVELNIIMVGTVREFDVKVQNIRQFNEGVGDNLSFEDAKITRDQRIDQVGIQMEKSQSRYMEIQMLYQGNYFLNHQLIGQSKLSQIPEIIDKIFISEDNKFFWDEKLNIFCFGGIISWFVLILGYCVFNSCKERCYKVQGYV